MRRLILPFGGLEWPQRTHLVLDEANTTLKLARGDSFTLSVKVRPGDRIPEAANATYRFADGAEVVDPLRTLEGGEFHGRIESVNQPFHFTVTAGDDRSLDPRRERAGRPPAQPQGADGPDGLAAIYGIADPDPGPRPDAVPGASRGPALELEAEASKPLKQAELRIGEDPAGGELAFDGSRTRFKTSIPVKESFTFWFGMLDSEGFRNRDAVRYDVRSFEDERAARGDRGAQDRSRYPGGCDRPRADRPGRRFRPALLGLDLPRRHGRVGAARRDPRSPSGRPMRSVRAPRHRRSSSIMKSPTIGSSRPSSSPSAR